jgi:hypothetical protein
MSKSTSPSTPETPDELTDDEQSVFERLADRYDDSDVGRIADLVLQSSKEDANE